METVETVETVTDTKRDSNNLVLVFIAGLALAFTLVMFFFFFRQRMFTRTEPIVLAS